MSVNSELTDLATYLSNAYTAIGNKGGTIPQNKNMYNLEDAINSIQTGSIIIIPPEAGTLTNLSVTTNPTKMNYLEGEYFDFTGLVITATYSSGQQFDVTGSCTYTMNQPLQVSDSGNVTATYEGLSVTINIVVTALPVPAPLTTTSLYHFDNSLKNEVTGNNATSSGNYVLGKFDTGIAEGAVTLEPLDLSANDLMNTSFTFEFWYKPISQYTQFSSMLQRYKDSTSVGSFGSLDQFSTITTSGFKMKTATGAGEYRFASSCTVDNIPSTFNLNIYHHFAFVVSQGTYQVYIDGTLSCHGNLDSSYCGIYKFVLQSGIGSSYFDEVLSCDSAKYSENFTPNNAPYYLQ